MVYNTGNGPQKKMLKQKKKVLEIEKKESKTLVK